MKSITATVTTVEALADLAVNQGTYDAHLKWTLDHRYVAAGAPPTPFLRSQNRSPGSVVHVNVGPELFAQLQPLFGWTDDRRPFTRENSVKWLTLNGIVKRLGFEDVGPRVKAAVAAAQAEKARQARNNRRLNIISAARAFFAATSGPTHFMSQSATVDSCDRLQTLFEGPQGYKVQVHFDRVAAEIEALVRCVIETREEKEPAA